MARINASELLAAGIMALGRVHVPYLYKRQSDLKFHLRGEYALERRLARVGVFVQSSPERRLFPGRPTGSAMPLAWTHAEFVKLMISRQLGYPFDRPAAVWRRYGSRRPEAKRAFWCLHAPIGRIEHGMALIIALPRAARIHYRCASCRRLQQGEANRHPRIPTRSREARSAPTVDFPDPETPLTITTAGPGGEASFVRPACRDINSLVLAPPRDP
jgi:hypothetical protein